MVGMFAAKVSNSYMPIVENYFAIYTCPGVVRCLHGKGRFDRLLHPGQDEAQRGGMVRSRRRWRDPDLHPVSDGALEAHLH